MCVQFGICFSPVAGDQYRAEAVLLATNGFGANEAMVRKYLGDSVADNAFYFGST